MVFGRELAINVPETPVHQYCPVCKTVNCNENGSVYNSLSRLLRKRLEISATSDDNAVSQRLNEHPRYFRLQKRNALIMGGLLINNGNF